MSSHLRGFNKSLLGKRHLCNSAPPFISFLYFFVFLVKIFFQAFNHVSLITETLDRTGNRVRSGMREKGSRLDSDLAHGVLDSRIRPYRRTVSSFFSLSLLLLSLLDLLRSFVIISLHYPVTFYPSFPDSTVFAQ